MDDKFIRGCWPEAQIIGNTITLQALSCQCLFSVKEFTVCVGGKKTNLNWSKIPCKEKNYHTNVIVHDRGELLSRVLF